MFGKNIKKNKITILAILVLSATTGCAAFKKFVNNVLDLEMKILKDNHIETNYVSKECKITSINIKNFDKDKYILMCIKKRIKCDNLGKEKAEIICKDIASSIESNIQ